MKTWIIRLVLLLNMVTVTTELWSQSEQKASRIPLLNEKAPAFIAESTEGTINFPTDYSHKWKIIFSYPADYSPVCTTELMELAKMQPEFKDLNVELLAVSTDNINQHKTWVKSMEDILSKDSNPVKINFPIIDDSKFEVGKKYGMLIPDHESFKAARVIYIIDPNDKIKAMTIYPMEVGRNIEEVKRMVIALQTAEKNTVLMPANWKPGDNVLLPYPKAVDHYEPSDFPAFYMLYTKLDQ